MYYYGEMLIFCSSCDLQHLFLWCFIKCYFFLNRSTFYSSSSSISGHWKIAIIGRICLFFWSFCFSCLKYLTIKLPQNENHWWLWLNGAFETIRWNFLMCVSSCSWVCSVCTVLYVFTESARECRVWPVCELWLDNRHRLMNWPWSMLVRTVCLHMVQYMSTLQCDCMCVGVKVCVYSPWPIMWLFFSPEKEGRLKYVSCPSLELHCWVGQRSRRACGSGSDPENVPDLWRCTIRGGYVCVCVCLCVHLTD